jgi:hypothetical protein
MNGYDPRHALGLLHLDELRDAIVAIDVSGPGFDNDLAHVGLCPKCALTFARELVDATTSLPVDRTPDQIEMTALLLGLAVGAHAARTAAAGSAA